MRLGCSWAETAKIFGFQKLTREASVHKRGARKRSKWVPKRAPSHPKIDPKKSPKSPQNRSRGVSGPPLGRKWGQTCLLDAIWWPAGGLWGSFWEGQWSQRGAKRSLKGAQWGVKGSQRRPKREPGARVGRPMGRAARHDGSFGLEYGKPRKTSYFIGSGRLGGVPSGPFLEPQRSFFGQLGAL